MSPDAAARPGPRPVGPADIALPPTEPVDMTAIMLQQLAEDLRSPRRP